MKKVLFIFAFLLLPYSTSAMNFIVTPDPTPDQTAQTDVYCDTDLSPTQGEGWALFEPNGTQALYDLCNSDNGYPFNGFLNDWLTLSSPEGLYTVASYGTQNTGWDGSSETIGSAISITTFCYGTCEETENAFSILVGEGDTVMTTVTGQDMGANVSYAGDTFYKPFMAIGISLLYYLRYWIVALIIISLITFFYKRVRNKV